MDLTQLIINGLVSILSSTGVVLVLREQIKSQQEQITAMKSNMDSMKSNVDMMKAYLDMFKPDQVERLIELKERTIHLDYKVKAKEHFASVFEEFEPNFRDKMKKMVDDLLWDEYQELYEFACDMAYGMPTELREEFVRKAFPRNAEAIFDSLATQGENSTDETNPKE